MRRANLRNVTFVRPTLLPVPEIIRDPYSSGRWILIAIHVGLVVCGIALILLPALT